MKLHIKPLDPVINFTLCDENEWPVAAVHTEDDAKYITLCVNAYDELIAALILAEQYVAKTVSAFPQGDGKNPCALDLEKIRSVLLKASQS